MDETFTLLPLYLDPVTKQLSNLTDPTNTALTTELQALNALHRSLLSIETPNQIPPPPVPLNPKRSAQIQKMREQANALFRKNISQTTAEAVKLYTYALEMALTRPPWEPSQIVRDEVSVLLSNRAQAHMSLQAWPEGAADAETSVEMKRVGNQKAWYRRGKCLFEMGKWVEAKEWLHKALEVESEDADLKGLMVEVEGRIGKEGR
ncbi:MAG: hypothetical protein MMC33_001258 [Icmadophila ericetorum]|nr:hypothetical protein [Icmadophila ericetorum]